jgi:hypothetical protein
MLCSDLLYENPRSIIYNWSNDIRLDFLVYKNCFKHRHNVISVRQIYIFNLFMDLGLFVISALHYSVLYVPETSCQIYRLNYFNNYI